MADPGVYPTCVMTPPLDLEMPDKTGKPTRMELRWVLVKLDDRQLVSVNFTLPRGAQSSRDAYIALMDRIADSIKPGGSRQQTK